MIKIKVRQIVVRGEQKFCVIKIEALEENKLPKRYINSEGYWVYLEHNILYANPKTFRNYEYSSRDNILAQGSTYSKESFEKVLAYCRRAGDELKKVNKELEEENKNWEGVKTYEI